MDGTEELKITNVTIKIYVEPIISIIRHALVEITYYELLIIFPVSGARQNIRWFWRGLRAMEQSAPNPVFLWPG